MTKVEKLKALNLVATIAHNKSQADRQFLHGESNTIKSVSDFAEWDELEELLSHGAE